MPLSSDITLPLDTEPVFPDQCIVCQQKPDSECKVGTSTQSGFLAFTIPLIEFFGRRNVVVPVCKSCKGKFRFQRLSRQVIGFLLIVAAVWWFIPRFNQWPGMSGKLMVTGVALLILSPYLVWEVFWPRFFDTTANKVQITYEFVSSRYAEFFHYLNRDDVMEADIEHEVGEEWYEYKSKLMEDILGPEHDMVLHALIPYVVGGALDIYYYPKPLVEGNSIQGTYLATKELAELPDCGSKNDVFSCYELVMGTRWPLEREADVDNDDEESTTPGKGVRQRNLSSAPCLAPYPPIECPHAPSS